MNIDLNESISKIEIDKGIIEKLKSFDIVLINDLVKLKRTSLKELNLTPSEIKQIIIKLELRGFDLNKK